MTTTAQNFFLFLGIFAGVICACLGLETRHSNHLGWGLLFAGTALIATGCLYLGAHLLTTKEDSQRRDRSLWLPCLGALLISLVTPLEYLFLPESLPRNDHAQDTGLILFAGSLVFFLLALHHARSGRGVHRLFSGTRSTTFKVANLFRILINPLTASLLLFVAGLGIGYSSLFGLAILFLLVLPDLYVRVSRTASR